jgi:hypothetical protein
VPNTALDTSASHDTALPSLLATSALDEALEGADNIHKPAKREQPTHLLKFRNFAIGSRTAGPKPSAHLPEGAITAPDNHVTEMAIEEAPKKKRKSDTGDTPKKRKVKA